MTTTEPAPTKAPTSSTKPAPIVTFVEAIEGYFHKNGQPELSLTNDCGDGRDGTDDVNFCTVFMGYAGEDLSYSLGPTNSFQVLMQRTVSPSGVSWKVLDSHESQGRMGGPASWAPDVVVYTIDTPGPATGTPQAAIGAWGELHGLDIARSCDGADGVPCAQYLGGPDGTGNYTVMIPTGSDGSAVLVEDVTVQSTDKGFVVAAAAPLGDYPPGEGSDN